MAFEETCSFETVKNLFIRISSEPVTALKNQATGGYKKTEKTVIFLDNDGDEKGILLILTVACPVSGWNLQFCCSPQGRKCDRHRKYSWNE